MMKIVVAALLFATPVYAQSYAELPKAAPSFTSEAAIVTTMEQRWPAKTPAELAEDDAQHNKLMTAAAIKEEQNARTTVGDVIKAFGVLFVEGMAYNYANSTTCRTRVRRNGTDITTTCY